MASIIAMMESTIMDSSRVVPGLESDRFAIRQGIPDNQYHLVRWRPSYHSRFAEYRLECAAAIQHSQSDRGSAIANRSAIGGWLWKRKTATGLGLGSSLLSLASFRNAER